MNLNPMHTAGTACLQLGMACGMLPMLSAYYNALGAMFLAIGGPGIDLDAWGRR
jgi:hypothetical protein